MSSRPFSDKHDRVRQLRIYCEVIHAGSIAGASEDLELTPPAVSLQVRELEHELGALLLERRSTGVVPTPAGKQLYAMAAPLVQDVDAVFSTPRGKLPGRRPQRLSVAVGFAGASFVLPRYVKRFHDRCPDVAVQLFTAPWQEGVQRVLDGKSDLMCGVRDSYPEKDLRYEELFTYGVVLIVPLDHPFAEDGGDGLAPGRDMSAHRAILPSKGTPSRPFGQDAARSLGLNLDAALEVGGWSDVKRYVETGAGIAVVPDICLKETDRLAVIPLGAQFPRRSYGIYTPRGQILTSPARCFREVLVSNPPGPAPLAAE